MEPLLERFGLYGTIWLFAEAAAIFLVSLVFAVIFNKLLFPLVLRFTDWTPTSFDARLIKGLQFPLTLGIILLGAYLAVVIPFVLSAEQLAVMNRAAVLAAIVVGIAAVALVVSNGFGWYIDHISHQTTSNLDDRLLPLFRRILVGVIYGLGGLLVLDQLNINISPMIAGLGLGGLAVALALQPTLSNLFAGTYVMTEGVVKPGDYVEMENGISGYVMDVSWRSTRIRTFYNNLVVVPNSRFAETIITNYQEPTPEMNIIVMGRVSLDSDLRYVEQVCRDVMEEVLETSPDAVKEFGAWFGFENFGESNVEFWLFVQAKDRIAGFGLRTALIETLRERLKDEGIAINYPVRSLRLGPENDGWVRSRLGRARAGANGRGRRRRHRTPTKPRPAPTMNVHLPSDMGQRPEGGGPDGGPGGRG